MAFFKSHKALVDTFNYICNNKVNGAVLSTSAFVVDRVEYAHGKVTVCLSAELYDLENGALGSRNPNGVDNWCDDIESSDKDY